MYFWYLVFEHHCLLFLSLARDYFYAHPIPLIPGKEWQEGTFNGGVGDLDDHCKHVLGKNWRVRLLSSSGPGPGQVRFRKVRVRQSPGQRTRNSKIWT